MNWSVTEIASSELLIYCAYCLGTCLFWTPWINADNNHSGKGDLETVGYNNRYEGGRVGRVTKELERRGIICSNPVKAECRARLTHSRRVHWYQAGDKTKFPSRINCDTTGLACIKSRQADGKCADYEVRLPQGRVDWRSRDRACRLLLRKASLTRLVETLKKAAISVSNE